MKKKLSLTLVILAMAFINSFAQYDWDNVPVPANAGTCKVWTLQENVSEILTILLILLIPEVILVITNGITVFMIKRMAHQTGGMVLVQLIGNTTTLL